MYCIYSLSLMDVGGCTACYDYFSCIAQILKCKSTGSNSYLTDELSSFHLNTICLTTQHIVFESDESDSIASNYLLTTSVAGSYCFKVLSCTTFPKSTIQQFIQSDELTYGLNYSMIAMESIITHNTAATIALTANQETKPEEEYLHYYGSNNFLLYFDIIRMFWHLLCALYSMFPLDFRITFILGNFVLIYSRSEVCWDMFDLNYRNQCLNGNWEQRFYFDHASLTCRQFWFDGCRSDSRNIFEDLLTCQWLCESQPMYKSRACLEDFDSHFKDECNGGRWRQQWYFDRNIKRCIAFWYDGCRGESENIFKDQQACQVACENPAKKDPKKPWYNNERRKMLEALSDIPKPNLTHICATSNPCKNNGTCIWIWKKNMHYCKCQAGYTGDSCTEKIDFDPCATNPCLNGATCKAKVEKGKVSFECYCALGFGGPNCDQRPCEVNPCLNNGTCRTTRGFSTYFCDCKEGFGGKNCDISIGSTPPKERYGSKVLLVSSGKEEWIQQMKERLGAVKKETTSTFADEPYKDSKTRKREREEREKQETEKIIEKEETHIEKKDVDRTAEDENLEFEKHVNETQSLKGTANLCFRYFFLAIVMFISFVRNFL